MSRPWRLHRTYCCRNHFLLVFHFLPRGGVSKNCLGRQFGIWCRSSGGKQTWYAEGLCSSVLCFSRVATMKLLCWDVGPPRGRILQLRGLNVATMAYTQYVLLQESFFVVLHFYFCHGMATAKIQPQEMNLCDLGFGHLVSGILKDLRPTIWPQQKISRHKK